MIQREPTEQEVNLAIAQFVGRYFSKGGEYIDNGQGTLKKFLFTRSLDALVLPIQKYGEFTEWDSGLFDMTVDIFTFKKPAHELASRLYKAIKALQGRE